MRAHASMSSSHFDSSFTRSSVSEPADDELASLSDAASVEGSVLDGPSSAASAASVAAAAAAASRRRARERRRRRRARRRASRARCASPRCTCRFARRSSRPSYTRRMSRSSWAPTRGVRWRSCGRTCQAPARARARTSEMSGNARAVSSRACEQEISTSGSSSRRSPRRAPAADADGRRGDSAGRRGSGCRAAAVRCGGSREAGCRTRHADSSRASAAGLRASAARADFSVATAVAAALDGDSTPCSSRAARRMCRGAARRRNAAGSGPSGIASMLTPEQRETLPRN